MKIDFLISNLKGGGAQRVMVLLAEHFSENGHEVSITTINIGEEYSIENRIKRIRLHGGSIKNHRIRGFLNILTYYKKKTNRPDILISFITQVNAYAIIAAKLYNIKVIVSEHNSHLRFQKPIWLTKLTRTILYRHANYVTVLTSFDIDFYKKKKANVIVMPNPCSFKPINNNNHKKEKTIIAVGNLDRYHHKGFDNLIKLIKPILEKNNDWTLKIIGGGDKGEIYLKDLAKKNGIINRVEFTGFTSNVREIMKVSEIFILPSRYEGLPMVLLEAGSQGMACIAYDCKTGPSDIITNNYNGLLIKDQDMTEMQDGLNKLIKNIELRKKLGTNAISSLDKYSMDSVGQNWEKLFL